MGLKCPRGGNPVRRDARRARKGRKLKKKKPMTRVNEGSMVQGRPWFKRRIVRLIWVLAGGMGGRVVGQPV